MIEIHEGLTFDDVLLVPQYSTIASRSDVNTSAKLGKFEFAHPVIPANMQSIMSADMVKAVIKSGGLAILHRFLPIEERLKIAEDATDSGNDQYGINHFAVSIGVKPSDLVNLGKFTEVGVSIVCIDIAHGDSKHCEDMIRSIRILCPNMTIIAGNVATGAGAARLWKAGANVVKIGIGPGSLCSTRIETGNGMPQITALIDVAQVRQTHFPDRAIIADGGMKSSGDLVKSLCLADMVMTGNLFAGCKETPGNTVITPDGPHKHYVGSSTHKTNYIEGVEALVRCKGPYQQVLNGLLEGIRSGCSYQGVTSIKELQDNPVFIKMSSAGLRESHPHINKE
jgi:IMP dehydrogenase